VKAGPAIRLAPAKLNLTLAVVGRRSDGYHGLHSVMVRLALADRVSVAPATGEADTLHVEGFDAGPDETNLVLRAVAQARGRIPRGSAPPLAIRLDKRIPVAAGLAGGSSDAAAALDAALEAWGAELAPEAHGDAAAALGSDVPFFLAGGAALVEGRGERVTPLRGLRGEPPGVLLVTPPVRLSTPAVFEAWDAGARVGGSAARMTSEHLAGELGAGMTAEQLLTRAGVLASANDLLPAAATILPELVGLRRALMRLLARPVGQSGSGPTLWALYPSLSSAEDAARAAREGSLPTIGEGEPFVHATTIERSDA
jgi:4-diphosphocytidyl-2-C-methyl-D-erythritol kinase